MFEFTLNGKQVEVSDNKSFLQYLREDARMTSVKNGCAEGACGACMIIVDGKAVRACLNTIEKVANKNVVTVEGLSEREKDVFAWAFSTAGAVQCGFCIPGMVVSGKALIDANPNPSKMDIKNAIRGNVCRCTGYVKIEKAIAMAAEALREGTEVPKTTCKGLVGEGIQRVDAAVKTLGTAEYVDDMQVPGMIYAVAVRSKYPRALVKAIDSTEAKALEGVVSVVTAADIPGNKKVGHLVKDWDALIAVGEETRYVGDVVALVAAETREIALKAAALVNVDYEELKPVSNTDMAREENAPKLHPNGNILKVEKLKRGNVEEAIANAKYVVTKKYSTPPTEHAFLEPECALAMPEGDGVLVYTGTQHVFDDQHEIMELLGLPEEKVRVISKYVGGGFGGKEDMSCQHHTALLAYVTKKPVKMTLTRKESIMTHPKRHAMDMEFTTACDENGKLVALKAEIVSDTGAYASLGGPVLQRACTHAGGPYSFENIEITGTAVYTNNPPGGAFRGFGVTQSAFALECNMNLLAEMTGLSPWEIRYRNAVEPGMVLANGQIADEGTAIKECLDAVKEEYEKHPYAGIACAIKNAGVGVGVPDIGRCKLAIVDGKIHLRTSAACIGQGLATTMIQIATEATGLSFHDFVADSPDTHLTPNSGTTTASRQTVLTGEATHQAALNLKAALDAGKTIKDLEGQEFYGEFFPKTDPMGSDKPNPVSHVAYGYAAQVVVIDENGKLVKVVAAHDVGKAINPINVEGQIEGGVVMGLGYGLTEDYPLKDSVPTAKFGTLGLFRAPAVPEIECKIIEKNNIDLSYGAKGVGEITVIPTAPAAQGAYYRLDGKFRTKLPLQETAYKK